MKSKPNTVEKKTLSNIFHWSDKFKYLYILGFVALTMSYLGFAFIPQPDKLVLHQYHLTPTSYRWILYPAVLLLVTSWTFGLLGSIRVKDYADLIKHSADGRAFNILGIGFLVLTISQPFTGLESSAIGQISRHVPRAVSTLTIINNYVNLVLVGLSLLLIARGADRLYVLAKKQRQLLTQDFWVGGFVAFSALYAYFIVIEPLHTPLARRIYFLPNWLLVVSIAIPYLFFWYKGLSAAYRIILYQKNSKGRLYKSAVNYLASGVVVVIASSIATRLITTISFKLSQLSLTPLLFVVYAIIAADAAGFILIAIGANKLKRIEEV